MNDGYEAVFTLNDPGSYELAPGTGVATVVVAVIIPPLVTINGDVVESDDDNTFTLNVDHDIASAEILVDAGVARIIINGTTRNPYTRGTLDHGDNTVTFTLMWPNGDLETYTIVVNRAIPFEQVVRVYWNNTLVASNNSENNGGYRFTSYRWYRNETQISTHQWWSAGSDGRHIDASDVFRVELTADGVSGILRSSESTATLRNANFTAYPNPVVQGQSIQVQADMEEDVMKGATIELYNYQGQLIETMPATSQATIHARYPRGIYILIFRCKDGLTKELKISVQ
jgi:hypothetical protein